MTVHECVNAELHSLVPYQPGKAIESIERELGITNLIKLASNENPLGPSIQAISAAKNVLEQSHLYPDGSYFRLKQAIAHINKLSKTEIIIGNGSDEILSFIARAFLTRGKNAVVSQYAFSTFNIVTRAALAETIVVPAVNYHCDLTAMAAAVTPKTGVIFIANPNNPTGTYVSHDAFADFLTKIPKHIIVVCDEAYYGYVQESDYPNTLALQKTFRNLMITRTFSKLYGLAGLRIGYGIASAEIIGYLNRIRLPFNVNIAGMEAAIAALLDHEHVEKTIALNNAGKQELLKGFASLKLTTLPSVTNFLTADFQHHSYNALNVFEKLLHQGIIVRPLIPYELHQHLRISIGLPEENARLLTSLKNILTS